MSCRGVAAISYIFALLGFMTVMTYTTKKRIKKSIFCIETKRMSNVTICLTVKPDADVAIDLYLLP